jgi:hypothetical protein
MWQLNKPYNKTVISTTNNYKRSDVRTSECIFDKFNFEYLLLCSIFKIQVINKRVLIRIGLDPVIRCLWAHHLKPQSELRFITELYIYTKLQSCSWAWLSTTPWICIGSIQPQYVIDLSGYYFKTSESGKVTNNYLLICDMINKKSVGKIWKEAIVAWYKEGSVPAFTWRNWEKNKNYSQNSQPTR